MHWFRGLWTRVESVVARDRVERELDEELADHLARETRKLVDAGVPADEAVRRARARLGRLDDVKEEVRAEFGTGVLDEAVRTTKVAIRGLIRRPGYAASTVLLLAAAMGAGVFVFSVVNAYLIRPLPFPEPDRLMAVDPFGVPDAQGLDRFGQPLGIYEMDWTEADEISDGVVAWDLDGFAILGGEEPESVAGAWVHPGFFQALGVTPALGRTFAPDEAGPDATVAVISDGLWRRRFAADPDIVGREIRAFSSDRPLEAEVFTVIGVLPADFWHFNRFYDLLVPLRSTRLPTMIRLADGMTKEEAEARLTGVVRSQMAEPLDPEWRLRLVPSGEWYTRDLRSTLLLLGAVAGGVLLIAFANAGILLLVRVSGRESEITVRRALGASGRRIGGMLLVEGVLLVGLAGVLGWTLASMGMSALTEPVMERLGLAAPGGLSAIRLDASAFGVLAAFVVLGALAFTAVPYLASRGLDLARSLGEGAGRTTESKGRRRARNALIVAEVALSLSLLVGAGLMTRSALHLQRLPLGFEPDGVLIGQFLLRLRSYETEPERAAFYDRFLDRLESVPGITAGAVGMGRPFQAQFPTRVTTAEAEAAGVAPVDVGARVVSSGHFEVIDVRLLEGRLLTDSDGPDVGVISASLAEDLFGQRPALGRLIQLPNANDHGDGGEPRQARVVGVVADVRETLTGDDLPDMYLTVRGNARPFATVAVRTAGTDPMAAFPVLREAIWSVDPTLPISQVGTLRELVDGERADSSFLATLLLGFSGYAVALALFGLYAVVAYSAARRRRDVAVRMALGAGTPRVVSSLASEGARLVAAGLVVGLVGAWGVSRGLVGFLYGVQPTDPATFGLFAAMLAVTAMFAVLVPAWRASRASPAVVLRDE